SGVRVRVREVLRPRAIQRPCVLKVYTGTTWGSRRDQEERFGKADSDDITVGRPIPWYLNNHGPPPSTSLRRQTAPCSCSIGEDAMNRDNHTVRLSLCESEQH